MRSELIRVVLCGAGLALAGHVVAQGKITGVETRQVGDTLKLQIVGEGLNKPKTLRGKDGKSYILEFNASLNTKGQKVHVYEGGLKAYKYAWYKSSQKLVRIQYWPEEKAQPKIIKNLDGWFVTWAAPTKANATSVNSSQSAKVTVDIKQTVPTPNKTEANSTNDEANSAKSDERISTSIWTLRFPTVPPTKKASSTPKTTSSKVVKPETKSTAKPEVKVEVKPTAKPEIKVETKPSAKSEVKLTSKTSAKPDVKVENKPTPNTNKPLVFTEAASKPANKPVEKPAVNTTPPAPKIKRVSLDFVNTDVVQILRALAIQSQVNIVTSPDVKGNLSVSLTNVTVNEALDLVTTLTGLAYQMTGKTYLVASRDKIRGMVNNIEGTTPNVVNKVVPIFSGEGTQIKATIVRSLPMETEDGSFDILLASEETKVEKKSEDKQGTDEKANGDNKETKIESKAVTGSKDMYVVVSGSAERVKEVSAVVQALDKQFCESLGIVYAPNSKMVRRSYQVRGGTADALATALAGAPTSGRYPKVANVEVSATPAASKSEQAIVLWGRENEVEEVLNTLASLDSDAQDGAEFVMYDVKFADPRHLREGVITLVPGIKASVPPASSGNPRLFKEGTALNEKMGENGINSNGEGKIDPKVYGEKVNDAGETEAGILQPFRDLESAAVPMRLLLRGTPDQIQSAMNYFRAVDIAPKQVALELRVMELSKEDALRVGIDWNIFTGGAVNTVRLNQSFPTAQNNSGGIRISGPGFGADVTATLDAIADKQRLIARPNLLAIDGRESEIFVGDIVRYVSNRSTNPTTGEINITIDRVPIGVRLAVLPRVGAGGNLTMDLRPVVSSITGFLDGGPGVRIPQNSTRVAQSTVQIMSGETIAIGGLIQEQDVRNISKVPFLGDLPIIGQLFRRTDNSKIRREVVFFLTAREVMASDRKNAADPRDSESKVPAEVAPLKKNGGN